ncbi:hypothetical protein [Plantibacter sp. T3]|nr:hypothetical protein [Plantibacter sp. T3]
MAFEKMFVPQGGVDVGAPGEDLFFVLQIARTAFSEVVPQAERDFSS